MMYNREAKEKRRQGMKIAICDSNSRDREAYLALFVSLAEIHKRDAEFDLYATCEEMLFHYEDKKDIDVLFLEVRMNGMSGFAAANRLRQLNFAGEIIFLTGIRDLPSLLAGYDVDAMHYIIKGETHMGKIEEIFIRAKDAAERSKQRHIMFTSRNEWINVPVGSIRYVEIYQRLAKVYYAGESFEFYCNSLVSIKEQLTGAGFIQTHRSFLVALKEIERLTAATLVTRNQQELPVGKTYYPQIKEALKQFGGIHTIE